MHYLYPKHRVVINSIIFIRLGQNGFNGYKKKVRIATPLDLTTSSNHTTLDLLQGRILLKESLVLMSFTSVGNTHTALLKSNSMNHNARARPA